MLFFQLPECSQTFHCLEHCSFLVEQGSRTNLGDTVILNLDLIEGLIFLWLEIRQLQLVLQHLEDGLKVYLDDHAFPFAISRLVSLPLIRISANDVAFIAFSSAHAFSWATINDVGQVDMRDGD